MDIIVEFIRRAATTGQSTWVNIHRRIILDGKRPPVFPGNAHQQLKTAVEDAGYWANRGHCVYLAQGMFRNAGDQRPNAPYPSAIRQEPNLVACKNLYMDIDVKANEGYASTNEALAALKDFHSQSKLPLPTIIVGSGNGGLHVYWTMDTEFEPREFRRLAAKLVAAGIQHGLKFDRQCTMDAIRLLRVPGTWNFKAGVGEPGKPVTLMHMARDDIKLDQMTKALEPYKAAAPASSAHRNSTSNLNEDLTGGMERSFAPVNIDEVAVDCPYIAHTLETGGVDLVGEPQWHAMAALACYTTDPHKTVHRLCEKNSFYNFEATEEKLAVAQRQREQRTLGPHKCAALSVFTSHCATCPHKDRGTTPLLLPLRRSSSNAFVSAKTASRSVTDLPETYYRGGNDLIYFQKPNDTGGNDEVLALEYQILPGSGSIEAGAPSYILSFDTIQGEQRVTKRIPTAAMASISAFMDAFHSNGLPITVKPDISRTMMASYIKLLQSDKTTLIKVPAFGWSTDFNGEWGFAYAGKFFSPAGEFLAGKPAEGVEIYRVQGDDAVWTGLMNVILTDDRPDLACLAASSFGAPLVYMTGENGFLMGLVSPESGIGKTTSLSCGQAIWAKPTLGGLIDTVNYTFAKCATLRHLPVIYDEIKGDKPTKAMVELVFQFTRGSEKGRSGRTGEMRAVREFETLCAYASNSSIVEAVRQVHQGTDADWLRMFEMQAIAIRNDNPNFTSEVKERMLALKLNFGGIGMRYAQFLGKNQVKLAKALLEYQAKLATQLRADSQMERFWLAAMATTLFGAYLANSQGYCQFPLEAMQQYMTAEYRRMKSALSLNPSDISTDIALVNMIGVFITEKLPRNLIVLDKTWPKSGRPPKNYATIRNEKPDHGWGPIEVQISGDPQTVKISDSALGVWCHHSGRPKAALVEQLRRKVNAKLIVTSIGSGSYRAGGRQQAWVFETAGTVLEDIFEAASQYNLLPP